MWLMIHVWRHAAAASAIARRLALEAGVRACVREAVGKYTQERQERAARQLACERVGGCSHAPTSEHGSGQRVRMDAYGCRRGYEDTANKDLQ